MDDSDTYTRRRMLRAGAGTAAGVTALQATGTAGAQGDAYGGYLSDADNFGGQTADASGQDEVTVQVGAQGNGGAFAYSPAAIYVEPGTTIVWEWTGEGGEHNVVNEGDAFESELTGEAGFTFERQFDETGAFQYFCLPHKSLGMKGVVVVGEDNVETDLVPYGQSDGGGIDTAAVAAGAGVFGAVVLLGVAAYRELLDPESV